MTKYCDEFQLKLVMERKYHNKNNLPLGGEGYSYYAFSLNPAAEGNRDYCSCRRSLSSAAPYGDGRFVQYLLRHV